MSTLSDNAQSLLVALYAPHAVITSSMLPDDLPKHQPMMAWVRRTEAGMTVDPMFGYFAASEHEPTEVVFVAVHPGQQAGIEVSLSWVFKHTPLPTMADFLRSGMIA